MTTKIRIIPETLANKIAAGEVVQRPASVVKELIENSIDADADEISVEIIRGGRGLIKVTDNGCGMARDDAILSIERFATSKIRSDDDLFNIKTLGFRGEALPSIASISKFSLTTKMEGELEGTHLYIEGGKLKNVQAVGAPKGTSIEVKDIFFNTPARLKFMKSNSSELFHITDIVVKIAASRPKLHLKLISDGKVVVDFTKAVDIYNRVCDIFASDVYRYLVKIDETDGNIHVFGFVSSPVYTAVSTKKFFTYINGRYISDKIVNYAVISAYKSKIEYGKYPAVVLFIEVPYDDVDVNVHPTKKDVRFKHQELVISCIENAIKNALSSPQLVGLENINKVEPTDSAKENDYTKAIKDSMKEYMEGAFAAQPIQERYSNATTNIQSKNYFNNDFIHVSNPYNNTTFRQEAPQRLYNDYIKVLGQVGASFIVCVKGESLLLIDQHAAHERILYNKLVQKYKEKKLIPQPLLIPIVFELSKSDGVILQGYINEFSSLGFTIEPFGKNSYAIKEVPDILFGYNYKEILHDIISDLMFLDKAENINDSASSLMKLVACKGAVKANKKLTEEEIMSLLQEMSKTDFPTNCPHGRPVVIELNAKDIRKMFKRE